MSHLGLQCQTHSIFEDTVYSCYCKLRLVTWPPPLSPMVGAEGTKNLITLDRWKRHFREKNYIENYFYFLKSTKITKIVSQKCWRNIIWADFFGRPYRTNGIKTCRSSPVVCKIQWIIPTYCLCHHQIGFLKLLYLSFPFPEIYCARFQCVHTFGGLCRGRSTVR